MAAPKGAVGSGEGDVVGDPRFFKRAVPLTLNDIVQGMGDAAPARSLSSQDAARRFNGVAPLQAATSQEIAFLDNRKYLPELERTKAGAVIVSGELADKAPRGVIVLASDKPYLAWARVASLFHPVRSDAVPHEGVVHPSAFVDPTARLGRGVMVGANAVIEGNAEIGDGCRIAAQALIGRGVRLGNHCHIGPHASVTHALLGNGVAVHAGARIGEAGFGFALGPDGFEDVPQVGRVVVEDDVRVGANVAIDRGSMRDTRIGAGSRIDNLVQIGHNARIGRCCVVVAQAGISGSAVLGDFVTVAAQAGLVGHIKIGDKARVGAQCGVMADVEPGADVIGSPARPFWEFFREVAVLRRLARPKARKWN